VGSDRRRTERLAALTQPRMPTSSPYLDPATHPVSVFPLARVSANRGFFARFLLDTHSASGCRSTRHSDTSRNRGKFSRCIKSARATRHLNATLVTRHSTAKFPPILRSLLFRSMLRIRLPLAFRPAAAHSGFCAARPRPAQSRAGAKLAGEPAQWAARRQRFAKAASKRILSASKGNLPHTTWASHCWR